MSFKISIFWSVCHTWEASFHILNIILSTLFPIFPLFPRVGFDYCCSWEFIQNVAFIVLYSSRVLWSWCRLLHDFFLILLCFFLSPFPSLQHIWLGEHSSLPWCIQHCCNGISKLLLLMAMRCFMSKLPWSFWYIVICQHLVLLYFIHSSGENG